ncbi:hypothetical protein NHG32_07255 [Aerococcaceae bacterium NML191219]|nr:hypothetical protein [Aerococcaceae bacterium NML191219]MDO4775508.1 hypothetical protein [Aerococcaceae bacterium]
MSMMMQLAEHILAIGQEQDIAVTNLALQKVMYFTIKAGYRNEVLTRGEIENIYDEPFLVWRYGPVVESIYEEFAIFGSNGITGNFEQKSMFNNLNELIRKLLQINVFSLVSRSHQEAFWIKNMPTEGMFRSTTRYEIDNIIGV